MLRLTLAPQTLHFKRPARTSRGSLAARELWVVRAMESGVPEVVGLGECGPIPGLSADDRPGFAAEAESVAQSIDRTEIQWDGAQNWQDWLDRVLGPWDAALASLPSLRFGLESALLDLRNGGRGRYFDTPFAHGLATMPTHGLIWMDTPAGLEAQVDAKLAAGFGAIKMKVGALPFDEELSLLQRLRYRHPQMTLRLDANGAFAPDEALSRLHELAPLHVAFLEQPLAAGQRTLLAQLCAVTPIPIVLDEELIGLEGENDLRDLLNTVRPQGIIIKPALLGGWRAATQAAALCESLGIAWWANSLLESSLGHDAICQWTAAYGGVHVHGLGTGGLFAQNFPSLVRLAGSHLVRDVDISPQDRGAIAA